METFYDKMGALILDYFHKFKDEVVSSIFRNFHDSLILTEILPVCMLTAIVSSRASS